MSTHIVIPDQHATPGRHNKRATWIGRLIADVRPNVVVNLGDGADMPSLSTYDKGKKAFQGRTYRKDIDVHLDFQDRLWHEVRKQKKKLPRSVYLIGNHEQRIDRAIQSQPELEGVISYDDLKLDEYYDEVVNYNGSSPGTIDVDGVLYAHYLISGILGRPISGEHHAYTLLNKHHVSCTVGHSHTFDYCLRTTGTGKKIMGLVAGCAIDFQQDFAGEANKLWHKGVAIKRNVSGGVYDLEYVSLETLKKNYG